MESIFEDNQFMNNMANFQSNQQKPSYISFPLAQKPANQNQNQSNNQKDPQPSSSSSCNFERLFSEIIEAQSDIESMDNGVQKFFNNYMESIVNPNEIKNTIKVPNYYQIRSFIDILAEQFSKFSRNFFLEANSLIRTKNKIIREFKPRFEEIKK